MDDEQRDGAHSQPYMDTNSDVVTHCKQSLDSVLQRLAQKRDIYNQAKLHRIGSTVSSTNCEGSDVDFLLEISRFVIEGEQSDRELFHLEYVEGKDNFRFVCDSKNKKIKTDQLYKDLEGDINEIVESEPDQVICTNWNHGGFAANKFSGVRCNGPAVTLLFKDNVDQDITCDVTIGLRLPEGDSAYDRLVRNIANKLPREEGKFRKEITDIGLFVVPLEHQSCSDEWTVSSAVIEPWLINQLEGDVKNAIIEFKKEKDTLNIKQCYMECDLDEKLYNDLREYNGTKNSKEKILNLSCEQVKHLDDNLKIKLRKEFSRQLRRGHLHLSHEQCHEINEPCAKHYGSINSSAIKFAAIEIFLTDRSVEKSKIIRKLLEKQFKDCLLERDIPIFTVALYAEKNKEVISNKCYNKLKELLPDAMDCEDSVDANENDVTDTANEQRDLDKFDVASYREHQEHCRRERVRMKEEPQSHLQNESSHRVTKVYIEGLTSYSGVDSNYDIKSFNSLKRDNWETKDHFSQSDAREAWRTSEAIKIELHNTLQDTTDLAAWIEKSDLFQYDFSASTLKLFACQKSSLFTTDIKGRHLLHWVAHYGDENSLEMILKKGVDLDTKDKHQGKVPLHYATIRRNSKIIDMLLKYGADLNAKDDFGKTPLHYLCEMVKRENEMLHATKRMLKLGADIGIKCNEGFTPVHSAINTDDGILDFLLKDSTRKIKITNGENHYLTFAILQGQSKKVCSLLEAGANVDGHLNDIYPPLHLATIRREDNIINILKEKGADVDKRDKRGKLALYYTT